MSVEKMALEIPFDVAKAATNTVKEIWSVLDAAAEKPTPSRYLGEKAIRAIQGVADRAQQGINAMTEET